MLNLHQLFFRPLDTDCFLGQLEVESQDSKALVAARTTIREHLRGGIAKLTRERLGAANEVKPKFFTQGSWAYKTLNDPAQLPPQEVDLDDGIYLPMSLMNGTAPSVACDAFYEIVDGLLFDLAASRGWTVDNKIKKTCTRVHINKRCHVDVPLYAIPDREYLALVEKSSQMGYATLDAAFREARAANLLVLDPNSVWLAVRGGKWQRSDPRKVQDWFLRQVSLYGDQFLRVCRYLKAWRDQQWTTGGPSSILLMVCAWQSFKAHAGRDDISMLAVAKDLVGLLAGDVYNPEVDPEAQLNSLSHAERIAASNKARELVAGLELAIERTDDAQVAIRALSGAFGTRIPSRLDWIKVVSPAEVVRSTAKTVVPAPAVQRVRSA